MRTAVQAALVTACFALAVGCGGGSKSARTSVSPSSSTPPSADTRVPATVSSGGTTSAGAPTSGPISNEPVAFQTDEGVTVHGHFYAAPGPRRRVVILAHQNGSDQKSWTPFAQDLASHGVAALTFDFRGFGETGGSQDIAKIDRDLDAAFRFTRSRDYPQIYVVGASMGGTAALKVAAREDLAGVVAVSAPVSFQGLDASTDVAKVTEPKLFIASRNDPNGAASALTTLLQAAPNPKDSQLYEGTARGTELLQGPDGAAFKQRLLDFIEK